MIPDYQEKAYPLTELLKKTQPETGINWGAGATTGLWNTQTVLSLQAHFIFTWSKQAIYIANWC